MDKYFGIKLKVSSELLYRFSGTLDEFCKVNKSTTLAEKKDGRYARGSAFLEANYQIRDNKHPFFATEEADAIIPESSTTRPNSPTQQGDPPTGDFLPLNDCDGLPYVAHGYLMPNDSHDPDSHDPDLIPQFFLTARAEATKPVQTAKPVQAASSKSSVTLDPNLAVTLDQNRPLVMKFSKTNTENDVPAGVQRFSRVS